MITRRFALIWLIVSQALGALSLLPWAFGLFLVWRNAAAAYDFGKQAEWWGVIYAMLAFPPLLLACAIVAWVLYRRNRLRGAIIATSVPLVPVAAVAIWLLTAS